MTNIWKAVLSEVVRKEPRGERQNNGQQQSPFGRIVSLLRGAGKKKKKLPQGDMYRNLSLKPKAARLSCWNRIALPLRDYLNQKPAGC